MSNDVILCAYHYVYIYVHLHSSSSSSFYLCAFLYSVPSPPRLLRKARDIKNGVELNCSWLPPVNPNGVITSYEIEYTTNSTFTTTNGSLPTKNSLTHYNWTGSEFPTYYMRVRAVNSANTDTGTMSKPSNVIEMCLGTERGTYT